MRLLLTYPQYKVIKTKRTNSKPPENHLNFYFVKFLFILKIYFLSSKNPIDCTVERIKNKYAKKFDHGRVDLE